MFQEKKYEDNINRSKWQFFNESTKKKIEIGSASIYIQKELASV